MNATQKTFLVIATCDNDVKKYKVHAHTEWAAEGMADNALARLSWKVRDWEFEVSPWQDGEESDCIELGSR